MQFSRNVNEPEEHSFYTNSSQNKWRDFLKKSKNPYFGPFFTIFVHFCLIGIFFQKIGLCQIQLYMGPILSFRQNYWANSQKTFGQTGQTDGQTDKPYFIGPFRPRPGVQYWNITAKEKLELLQMFWIKISFWLGRIEFQNSI